MALCAHLVNMYFDLTSNKIIILNILSDDWILGVLIERKLQFLEGVE